METSQTGIDLLADLEGLRLQLYYCSAGKTTIGYGHQVLPGEDFSAGITKEKAKELLKVDLKKAENAVNRFVKIKLNQNQFDSLVSFCFNVGKGNFLGSTLLKLVNANNLEGAAKQFNRWIYVNKKVSEGLAKRRYKEKELFLKS